jgi:hypothetical protein
MEAGPARIEAEASETGDDGAEALPRPPRRSSQAHAVFKKPVKTKKIGSLRFRRFLEKSVEFNKIW